ncbi:potassium channel family protein [Natranaeroarchaeum sulfidigenes]|uniref:potassium channel family protein n=1 Tax=Natranaeroarchaeum sulfidigenes TaxID=2784880 RepID=UPI001EE51A10|nr:TrkA family potassium uptake protein [Natranaeroarchaeum sulfidigenes]
MSSFQPSNGPLRVVLVGSGRTGLRTARILAEHDHDVVVVERRDDRVQLLENEYIATVIHGDATRPSVLRQADLESADVIAGLTDTEGTNLAACTIARETNPSIRTVMRTTHDGSEYGEFVDATFTPEESGAGAAASAIETGVRTLKATVGDVRILEITAGSAAPVAGRTLSEVSLPRGSLVISENDSDSIAGPDTELVAGRQYILATEPAVADEVVNLFRG